MKRKEKNDLLKKTGEVIDGILTSTSLTPVQAAKLIEVLQEIDQGMYIDHTKRAYIEAVKSGKINLDIEVTR